MTYITPEVWDRWYYMAKLLIKYKPDATLWDLLVVMYQFVTGNPMPKELLEDGYEIT